MPETRIEGRPVIEWKESFEIDLEQDLGADFLAWLGERGVAHCFKRNAYLYHQGDSATTVYVLRSGSVKATCTDRFGRDTLLKIHGPGSFLGLSALRPQAIRDATGMALEDCQTVAFRREDFFALMQSEGQLGIVLVQLLLKRQQELHARVSEMTSHRVDQRLARVLLQLSAEARSRARNDEQVKIPVTHEELATLVLSRRQYVTAILRSFSSHGLIHNRRGQIVVRDPGGLQQIAGGEQSALM